MQLYQTSEGLINLDKVVSIRAKKGKREDAGLYLVVFYMVDGSHFVESHCDTWEQATHRRSELLGELDPRFGPMP